MYGYLQPFINALLMEVMVARLETSDPLSHLKVTHTHHTTVREGEGGRGREEREKGREGERERGRGREYNHGMCKVIWNMTHTDITHGTCLTSCHLHLSCGVFLTEVY